MDIKIANECHISRGCYKGIKFEICRWEVEMFGGREEQWAYYLSINLNKIPEKDNPDSYWLPSDNSYREHPVLSEMYWHGGITFYDKVSGFDDDPRIIEVGCDYQHYEDEGSTLEACLWDCQQSIESFLTYIPDYKRRCVGNGKLYDSKDGIIKEHEGYGEEFYSNEYLEKEKRRNENTKH
jgi:hypothetical protein